MRRDFKTGPKRRNCSVCGIPGHFAKDCWRKKTTQCSNCVEIDHIDRACKRQINGGKDESVAIGSNIVYTIWGTLGSSYTVEDSSHASGHGCTNHIVTNFDALLDYVPIKSVVRNPIGKASRVVDRGYMKISIPSNKRNFNANSRKFSVCLTIPKTSYQS